ncbi:hypothetical protein I6F53_19490 [Pseudoalteromonas sp. SWN29]|uniref:hypothetical protein n=1 Tax=Pseudoalteromonas sp. SWN29 TaxID=2792064 RepID=UPI0018CFD7DD|nr:hypothetical protein [Pseudoalteromonas sp. SWN29]MBH0029141.1 hypothetical protein [Pseudoalteromonas sp. SWN29]
MSNIGLTKNEVEEDKHQEDEVFFSVDVVINNFIHRVLDIEDCASNFITLAVSNYQANAERLKLELAECQDLLKSEEEQEKKLIAVRRFRQCDREVERHNNSNPVEVLEKSLFISLFSAFDKYIGDLIAVIYSINPELYKNINREIQLSEALTYNSIEELREVILDKEIETIKRKSYIEQFNDLEKRFSIKLTKFEAWPVFIEMSQRRNLFTHCDGIVSKQYLDICKSVGYKSKNIPSVGEQLKIGGEYFYHSCHIMVQVAVMLGQTLWRKTSPGCISEIDESLNSLIFDFLHTEDWGKSITLCKYAKDLPKISDDLMERMFSINYSIALKAIGENSAAKKVLDTKDWTATTYDFRLAYAVICDDFEEAGNLMCRIGKEGDLISEMAYHDWPLFRDFRESTEFFESYEKVFGYKYTSKLNSIVGKKDSEISELAVANED